MKHKRRFLLLAMLFVLACSGCTDLASKEIIQAVSTVPVQTKAFQATVTETKNPASAEELMKIGTISGTVVDFSDSGCRITPTQYEENVAYEAAPGYETELVTIGYGEGCTFQIANVNVQTGAVTYEPAGIENIVEQVSLVVCGEYDSDSVLQGKDVFIYRSVR